jgi:hypothetical protein
MGAGGNAAIESAAALANALKRIAELEKGNPSLETVKMYFASYHQSRELRASAILEAANSLTRIHALKTIKEKIMTHYIFPIAGDAPVNLTADMIIGATMLDYLPPPARSLVAKMPFNPEQGLGKQEWKSMRALQALPFLILLLLALQCMWGWTIDSVIGRIGEIMKAGQVECTLGTPGIVHVRQSFYGIRYLDDMWRGITVCFMVFQFTDQVSNWQIFSFITDLGVMYAIWLIESARRSNILTFAQMQDSYLISLLMLC